ncbi:MAG TPA: hypothetical protein PK590_02910 [Candidatus Omnitrophota bacterium]|nr:hypothetical protein [Candidatus Omnitrophota bacterium]
MISLNEITGQQRVFDAVRTTVQELHADCSFVEDVTSSPLLFKSEDEKIWVRIFYQPMNGSSAGEIAREVMKLKLLMPKHAVIYFFYPELDRDQIVSLRSRYRHIAFFEYGSLLETANGKEGVKVCKWIPISELSPAGTVEIKSPFFGESKPHPFLSHARLTQDEISELNDIGLSFRDV